MNTIDLSARSRLVAGVRVESTHVDTLSFNENTGLKDFKAGGNYTDVLPSAAFRYALNADTDIRVAYSRGLSRPDPQDLTQAVGTIDDTQNPPTVSIGNPDAESRAREELRPAVRALPEAARPRFRRATSTRR